MFASRSTGGLGEVHGDRRGKEIALFTAILKSEFPDHCPAFRVKDESI
jgi:hypothetical protein